MLEGIQNLLVDRRFKECAAWPQWLRKLPEIRDIQKAWDGFDAFRYNETCSVGLISNAAHDAGFITQLEYSTTKRRATRGRPHFNGRVDLWVGELDSEYSWAIEFKQLFIGNRTGIRRVSDRLVQALKSSDAVRPTESHRSFGCVILVPFDKYGESDVDVDKLDRIAVEACKKANLIGRSHGRAMVWRVGGGTCPVWLLFKEPK